MCGIFGCLLLNNNVNIKVSKITYDALNLLKNRGYDSCGIYFNNSNSNNNNKIIYKLGVDGDIIKNNTQSNDIFEVLKNKLNDIEKDENYNISIGHTRWATHGGKTDYNSHPHNSSNGKIIIVHNGIISNFQEIKELYLKDYNFYSNTDSEVIANLIQYFKNLLKTNLVDVIHKVTEILVGTWACIIHDLDEPDKLYFMKNENPLLIGFNNDVVMFTSEPSGFLNMIDEYYLLREKTYGWINNNGVKHIIGNYKKLDLIKSSSNDINLSLEYPNWMKKEIFEQSKLTVLIDPLTNKLRYNNMGILFNYDFIKSCKYLYIIACGSSYYAGLIASNYFRYTKAFEFVNVIDGGEFTKAHLEAISNPEKDLLVLLISQSGETRDLNLATTICREFSSNRKYILEPNILLVNNDSVSNILKNNNQPVNNTHIDEIKIIGIINVIGSLISRRTIDNIYTNCGRENSVASTKSCTSQILACLLLAIYKSELNGLLNIELKNKFISDLNLLELDISQVLKLDTHIKLIAKLLLSKNKSSMFLLGKNELYGCALEGALKIKEIAYIHAEGFNISALKHGPYALIEQNTPIIIIYKEKDHFVKSIIEEVKTRGAFVIEISHDVEETETSIKIPYNKTFTGLLTVIVLQLLAYHLSVEQNINPDRPRNLAKVVTVD
jgi:glucosamine--fructose-6-phosphate aminotransferase (isomerizing)